MDNRTETDQEKKEEATPCKAHLYIGDDFGDNSATMHCQLPMNHPGRHQEVFRKGTVTVTWEKDEGPETCFHCNHPETGDICE